MITEASQPELSLWSALIAHQGKPFETAHHLEFTYTIHNKEMFVSRKEKSITRSTVELAFHKVVELQAAGIPVDGPKMIGTFGASYLYPVFRLLGIISTSGSLGIIPNNHQVGHEACGIIPDNSLSFIDNGSIINKTTMEGLTDMPRGVKGSGKVKATVKDTVNATAKETATTKRPYHRMSKETPVTETPVEMIVEAGTVTITDKPRKPYPSTDERITMADQQIARLTALRASRETLVAKAETILAERQKALASCTTALEKAVAKKERLVAAQSKPPKAPKEKLTPEERKARMAAGRAAKKAENEKYAALVAALKDSGKSVDELLAELKG